MQGPEFTSAPVLALPLTLPLPLPCPCPCPFSSWKGAGNAGNPSLCELLNFICY